MMLLRSISSSPEEQGVSAIARTSRFFPCEDAFSSHYAPKGFFLLLLYRLSS
jgi:hypothetical protein